MVFFLNLVGVKDIQTFKLFSLLFSVIVSKGNEGNKFQILELSNIQ